MRSFYFSIQVEERKRDKAEEKAARDRVRAQIEADKAARRAKAGQAPLPVAAPQPTPAPTSTITSPPKDYKQTRIQIRLPNGTALTETFEKNEQLSAVRLFVQLKQEESGVASFGMMTTFPRKVFAGDDYDMTLEQLGLVPSATIMVTKVPS